MAARHTKKQILSWVEGHFMSYDILCVTEELLGDGYREWLIKEVVKVLSRQRTQDIEDHFDEDLTEPAIATIKKAKREDMIKAIIDGMGYDDEKEMSNSISDDSGEEC